MIIFAIKTPQRTWRKEYPEAVYGCSHNGWSDDELGYKWLTDVFDPETRDYGIRLLIIDGHASHISVQFVRYCWANNIVPLCLPPHTTHYLQPLDIGLFSPLSMAYKRQLEARNKVGLCFVDRIEFLSMFRTCREEVYTHNNIFSGWARSGKFGRLVLV